jgi:hypothetical protein
MILVYRDYHIHEERWQETGPDNRHDQDVKQVRICQVSMDPGGQCLLIAPGLRLKIDPFPFDPVEKLLFLLLYLNTQLFLEFFLFPL